MNKRMYGFLLAAVSAMVFCVSLFYGCPVEAHNGKVALAVPVEGIVVEAERSRERIRFEEDAGVTTRELAISEIKGIPGLVEADPLRAVEVLPGVITTSDFSSAYKLDAFISPTTMAASKTAFDLAFVIVMLMLLFGFGGPCSRGIHEHGLKRSRAIRQSV